MKKAIVTTTINPPTKALKEFIKIARQDDWHLFIVGDLKTPHKQYLDIETAVDCVTYITPDKQKEISQKLSDLIGWNCIQRRNFGLIAAYQWGARVIATVDDDNIPYPGWGKSLKVNKTIDLSTYSVDAPVFDPLSPIFPHLWHRGFPVQLLDERHLSRPVLTKRTVLVQADFWDGSPDIDAVCRITLNPIIKFEPTMIPLGSNKPGPFNSQNTFLSRDVFPTYFLFPHIGRMDDIFASYITQAHFPSSVAYCKASVYQERNEHDLTKDLEAEMIGYQHALDLVKWLEQERAGEADTLPDWFPKQAIDAWIVYQKIINASNPGESEG